MPSYDLVDRPWLPCVTQDGSVTEVSLRHALGSAHELRELYDPSPLVTVALHRLLLAVLHRAYLGPATMGDWRDTWRAERFDAERITAYLDRWQHRFDLFDQQRPFYQVPFIPELAGTKKQASVVKLAQEAAAGNNATLFDHSVDAAPVALPAAAAARSLVAVQAFSIGFGRSFPFYLADSTMIRGFSVLAVGASLFETLALNLMPYTKDRPVPWLHDDDQPCWEQAEPLAPDKNGTPVQGYTNLLTWQSRQIHLTPDGDGATVTRCQFRQNLKVAGNPVEPFKCYLVDEQRGLRPRSFRPERALWRDSTLLFEQLQLASGRSSQRPELMNWLAEIERERERNRITAQATYRLRAYGLTTDDGNAASVLLWRREELPLPLALLDEPLAIAAVEQAIAIAERVSRVLNASARRLATLLLAPLSDEDARVPDFEKAVRPLMRSLGIEQRFWPRLETPFAELLVALPDDRSVVPDSEGEIEFGAVSLPRWVATVRTAARQAFVSATAGFGRSGRELKAIAVAQSAFERGLAKELAPWADRRERRGSMSDAEGAAQQRSRLHVSRLVHGLETLVEREDRAALAALRRGLGKRPGEAPAMFPVLVPLLPPQLWPWDEECAYLVASLFGLHPVSWTGEAGRYGSRNLGAALRRYQDLSASKGAQRRLIALLNSDADDLGHNLRGVVALLRGKDVPIDWEQLTWDVLAWDRPSRDVQ